MATKADVVELVKSKLVEYANTTPTSLANITLSKRDCDVIADVVLEALEEAVRMSDTPLRTKIGAFSMKETKARSGRNPRTNEVVVIPAKRQMKFVPNKKRVEVLGVAADVATSSARPSVQFAK